VTEKRIDPAKLDRLRACLQKASRVNPDSPHNRELRKLIRDPGVLDWLEARAFEGSERDYPGGSEHAESDPWPLLEESDEGRTLPTVEEWLAEGGPMREVDS
jgi:hypothetical protein